MFALAWKSLQSGQSFARPLHRRGGPCGHFCSAIFESAQLLLAAAASSSTPRRKKACNCNTSPVSVSRNCKTVTAWCFKHCLLSVHVSWLEIGASSAVRSVSKRCWLSLPPRLRRRSCRWALRLRLAPMRQVRVQTCKAAKLAHGGADRACNRILDLPCVVCRLVQRRRALRGGLEWREQGCAHPGHRHGQAWVLRDGRSIPARHSVIASTI